MHQPVVSHRANLSKTDSGSFVFDVKRPFGIEFSIVNERELIDHLALVEITPGCGPKQLATANLDHIVQMDRNTAFRQAYSRAWIVTADGMPIYLYARFCGIKLPQRITGATLFGRLIEILDPRRHRCYFVCSTDEVARLIEGRLVARGFTSETLNFCVPPFGFERDAAYSERLAERIRLHKATHLFMGLGAPKSEIWTDRYRDVIGDCYVLNVGAALDFWAGTKRRAPKILQSVGLEWAWRVASEPRRLFKRYFLDSWRFLRIVVFDMRRNAVTVPDGPSSVTRSETKSDKEV